MEAGGRGGSTKRQYYAAFAEAMGEEEVVMVEEEGGVVVKKRRLTMEQVRYLESSFESENKLEPERKAHIAHKLGLQPRQVAVWFQNRRARSKSKQLERDFNALKADYHAVMLQNEELQAEVNRLKEQLRERSVPQEEDRRDVETDIKQVKTSGSNVCSSNYVVGGVEAEAEVEASTASGGAERGNELGDGEEQSSPCAILADMSASVLAASGVPAAAAVRAKVAVAESAASYEELLSEEIHLLTGMQQQAYYAHHVDFYADLNDNSLFVSYNPWSDD